MDELEKQHQVELRIARQRLAIEKKIKLQELEIDTFRRNIESK